MRQGRLNDATCVIVNGRLGSGAWVPALTCACAATVTTVNNNVVCTNTFMGSFLVRDTGRTETVSLVGSHTQRASSWRRETIQSGPIPRTDTG